MTCNRAHELLAESLAAPLPGAAAAELAAHLAACDACRAEAAALRRIWEELERLPEEIPGEEMRQRFAANLEPWLAAEAAARRSGHAGLSGGTRRALARLGGALEGWLERWLPRRPLAQAGLAAATLVLGVLIGGSGRGFGGWPEKGGSPAVPAVSAVSATSATSATAPTLAAPAAQIGELRDEVRSLSRLVTLSLLKQDSASERLRGVSFGRQAGGGDDDVLQALLDTLRHDPDVNVRLAAVDALAPALARPALRDQMLQQVASQPSPMVQIALIDLLLRRDRDGSRNRLQELAASPGLDATVRDYLRSRLRRLS
jgi:hypothetical protein